MSSKLPWKNKELFHQEHIQSKEYTTEHAYRYPRCICGCKPQDHEGRGMAWPSRFSKYLGKCRKCGWSRSTKTFQTRGCRTYRPDLSSPAPIRHRNTK